MIDFKKIRDGKFGCTCVGVADEITCAIHGDFDLYVHNLQLETAKAVIEEIELWLGADSSIMNQSPLFAKLNQLKQELK